MMSLSVTKTNVALSGTHLRRSALKVSCGSASRGPASKKNNDKFDINKVIERRKEMDKQRIERIKEIGHSISHIAKIEMKDSTDSFNEYFPFLKDFKGIRKDDIDRFCEEKKKEWSKKADGATQSTSPPQQFVDIEIVNDEDD